MERKFQERLKRYENELRDIKTAARFTGKVDCYQVEVPSMSRKMTITFAADITSTPIVAVSSSNGRSNILLGQYDSVSKTQRVFATSEGAIVVFTSTQPIVSITAE